MNRLKITLAFLISQGLKSIVGYRISYLKLCLQTLHEIKLKFLEFPFDAWTLSETRCLQTLRCCSPITTVLHISPWAEGVSVTGTVTSAYQTQRGKIHFWNIFEIFSTACSIVYKYCTRPISKHLHSGIFKDPLDMKHKIFKKKTIHKCYVSCLKLEYFFKSCKT